MAFKPIDPKRDEFRRYLERAGVIEAFTKVFAKLVQERPADPMDYIKKNLGISLQENDTFTYLQNELEESKNEVQRLRSLIEEISPRNLQKLEKDAEKHTKDEDAKEDDSTKTEPSNKNEICAEIDQKEEDTNCTTKTLDS